MLPTPLTYMIWPAVVPADKKTTMTITSTEPAHLVIEGKEYTVNVISVCSDENYYSPEKHQKFQINSDASGVLTFDFTFEGEQEHTIQLIRHDRVVQTFTVYSLYEDLYKLTPLKGDLHSHSCRSDGGRDPSSQAGHYREQGFDFAALTDHNRYYPGNEIDRAFEGVNTGFTRVTGEEVHCPGSVIHMIHVGGKASVADRYVHDRENYEAEIAEYMEKVPANIPEKYKSRYAKAMWATDSIHSVGGIAIFPHPFWRPGGSKTYNVCPEFANILLKSGMFDAYELVGGMTQPDINRSVAMWNDARASGFSIPVVGSSDVHSLERSVHFPYYVTVCFAEEKTNDAIIAAVKEGKCVAVETSGDDYARQYRCYGEFRLVSYAQFLLANYFPKLQRATAGTGVAMRAYIMGEADASLVEQHTALANNFTERFFGRKAPALPSAALFEFEAECRNAQLNGPKTRGSSVDATPAASLI